MFSSHKVRSIFLSTPCLFLFHLKILIHCIDSTWQIFSLSTSHTNTHFSNPHTIFLTFFHTLLILTNFRTTEQHTKKKDNTSPLIHEKPHRNQTLTEHSPSTISISCRSSSASHHASASWNLIHHDHHRQLPKLANWASDGKSRRSPSPTTVGTSLVRYLSPKLPVAILIGLKFSPSKSSSCVKHESSTRNLRSSNPLPRRSSTWWR